MGQRTELHEMLVTALGSRNVYFQPPEGYKLNYPCIVYERDKIDTDHADNKPYRHTKRYSVTVIEKDPESPVPDRIAEMPSCSHDRHFSSENLHHDVFTLYF